MSLNIDSVSFTSRGFYYRNRQRRAVARKGWMMPYYTKRPIEIKTSILTKLKRFFADKLGLSSK